ncbi:hypothetical protein LC040_12040 [Bacillus tianshenii]|nr:hypothetical protein LC040_12040 [Bacillus tianshenii]
MNMFPVIPADKNYWLVRTQSGKYYGEFRRKGFIGINWEEIKLEDINNLTNEELTHKIKEHYPDKPRPGTTASQLRIFKNHIKKGDTVVITGVSSNKFSIGEVLEDECYIEAVTEEELEANPKLCPYEKRKKVKWIKEVHKWDVDMPMFKLLQHAQHTITDANEYNDVIESMIHDFYIRGEYAQLSLKVKKEENIPMLSFFALGKEILDLADELNEFSDKIYMDLDAIETQINVNSPGKVKLRGPMLSILALGVLIVSAAGGGITINPPSQDGPGSLEFQSNSIISEVNNFLNDKQKREHKEMIMTEYMDDLDIETPEELSKLLNALENKNN